MVFGELGFVGEIPPVPTAGQERLKEGGQARFTACYVPKANAPRSRPRECQVIGNATWIRHWRDFE